MEFKYLKAVMEKSAEEKNQFPYLSAVLEKYAQEEAEDVQPEQEPILVSPEEFVIELEHAVNNGQITEDEALAILEQAEEALRQHFESVNPDRKEGEVEKEASALPMKANPKVFTKVISALKGLKDDSVRGAKLWGKAFNVASNRGMDKARAAYRATKIIAKHNPKLAIIPGVGIVGAVGAGYGGYKSLSD